jgi:hypothetical protein
MTDTSIGEAPTFPSAAAPCKTFITLTDPDAGQGSGQGTFAGNVNLEGEIAGYYIDK